MKFKVILTKEDDFEGFKVTEAQIEKCQKYLERYLEECLYCPISDALYGWADDNLEYNDDDEDE